MKEIRGDAKNIRTLLSGARFSVDYYQREYRWESKQIAELVEDLSEKFLESYEEGDERSAVESYGHYFLGSIIISNKDGRKYIIDGQQRLPTRRGFAEVAPDPPVQTPTPHPIQQRALEALQATRRQGYTAGLVVLATGLGKTWLSAFDSASFERVLFVAHREEILSQAMATFRSMRPNSRLGRYSGADKDVDAEVLFASIQTLGRSAQAPAADGICLWLGLENPVTESPSATPLATLSPFFQPLAAYLRLFLSNSPHPFPVRYGARARILEERFERAVRDFDPRARRGVQENVLKSRDVAQIVGAIVLSVRIDVIDNVVCRRPGPVKGRCYDPVYHMAVDLKVA
ncbi:MAG: DEAD/DEAH box helicase family protein [Reyranella sp.]